VSQGGWLRPEAGGVTIEVRARPRASRTRAAGLLGDALKVELAAPPVDGEANAELIAYLAKTLGVRKSDVELLQGETGRNKVLRVRGVTAKAVEEALLS